MTIVTGDSGGINFREMETSNFPGVTFTSYQFRLSSDGSYELHFSSQASPLLSGSSNTIKAGLNQSNLLTVIARGSNIYLFVNKQYVASISDSNSSAGAIGLFAYSMGTSATKVAFSNAQLWRL